MFPHIKKPELNPLIYSKLLDLDLNSPVHEIQIGTDWTELSLKMKDNTAVLFRLPAYKNSDAHELKERIISIVNTAHNSPRRNKLIAEALTGFLNSKGAEPFFEVKLAIPALIVDKSGMNIHQNGDNQTSSFCSLPEMPIGVEYSGNIFSSELSLPAIPGSANSRAEDIRQKTIDLGGPKNLNRRRIRSFGFF